MIGTDREEPKREKEILAGVSIFMAAIVLGAVAACGMPYDYADENDLSRWLVEFTCDHPNDLSENSAKYSVHVLSELQKNHNPFTINMPYDSAYEEMGLADPAFTLEPKQNSFIIAKESAANVL